MAAKKPTRPPGRIPTRTEASKAPTRRRRYMPYSDDIAADVLERVSVGEPINQICRDEDMPSRRSVYYWMHTHEAFRETMIIASREGLGAWADDMVEIADDPTGDVQRDKLRIDTRKWIMAKLAPAKWGEVKHKHEHSGEIKVESTLSESQALELLKKHGMAP